MRHHCPSLQSRVSRVQSVIHPRFRVLIRSGATSVTLRPCAWMKSRTQSEGMTIGPPGAPSSGRLIAPMSVIRRWSR